MKRLIFPASLPTHLKYSLHLPLLYASDPEFSREPMQTAIKGLWCEDVQDPADVNEPFVLRVQTHLFSPAL